MLIFGQAVFALGAPEIKKTDSNTDFAKISADIVYLYDNDKSGVQPDSAGDYLRIIGKAKNPKYKFSSLGAAECVVNSDGRFLLQFNDSRTLDKCLEKLKSDSSIIYAEKDRPIYTCGEENESEAPLSWGVSALKADIYAKEVASESSDKSVTVAIVDSGVAPIDFIKDRLVDGYDFITNTVGGTIDTNTDSHGTFLASIVTDTTENANVKIMPVRVLQSKTGSLANGVNGIYYAVDNGADVVNISLGARSLGCDSLDDALAYAERKNVVAVVCAGNSGLNTETTCPAHIDSVITVSAVDNNLVFAESFSNFGEKVDVCAPGVNVIGYGANGKTKSMSGTSMSAAYISACAALYKLQNSERSSSQIQEIIKKSCKDLGDIGFDEKYGYGIPQCDFFNKDETVYVDGIHFNENEISLKVGQKIKLNPIITPENATDKSYKAVADGDIISIGEDNSITAIGVGSSKVRFITNDGNFELTIFINVTDNSAVQTPTDVPTTQPTTKPETEPATKRTLDKIEVLTPPEKTSYIYKIDKAVDLSGIVVRAYYSDNSYENITDTSKIHAKGYDPKTAGTQTVTVEYEGEKTEITVTVKYAWWQWIIRILLLGFLWY